MSDATLLLPARIDAFTDFLCSIDHTLRMGNGTAAGLQSAADCL